MSTAQIALQKSAYSRAIIQWFFDRAGQGQREHSGAKMSDYGWNNTPARRRTLQQMEEVGLVFSYRVRTPAGGMEKYYSFQPDANVETHGLAS